MLTLHNIGIAVEHEKRYCLNNNKTNQDLYAQLYPNPSGGLALLPPSNPSGRGMQGMAPLVYTLKSNKVANPPVPIIDPNRAKPKTMPEAIAAGEVEIVERRNPAGQVRRVPIRVPIERRRANRAASGGELVFTTWSTPSRTCRAARSAARGGQTRSAPSATTGRRLKTRRSLPAEEGARGEDDSAQLEPRREWRRH